MAKPASYKDLLAPELTGKIAFVDDTLATWPLIAAVTGYGDKFPNLTKDELADMYAKFEPYRAQSRVVSLTYGDVVALFNSGEIAALYCGWTGIPNETAKSGVTTEYTIPEEGAGTWCDAWFIPPSSDNDDTAYAFINEAISPEIQAKVATRNAAGVVSSKAVALLPPETKVLFDYDNAENIFKKAPLLGLPPMESTDLATYADWVEAWNAFKAF